jgi:hypothetical protein
MSLRIDVKNVENYMEKCYVTDDDGEVVAYTPTYQVLSMLSMSCGFGAITEKNWKKVFSRIYAVERALGPMRINPDGPEEKFYFSPKEIKDFIGMTANVVDETDASFRKRLMGMIEDSANREIRSMDNS